MIIRNAGVRHAKVLDVLFSKSGFELEPRHLLSSVVVEKETSADVIAIGTFNTIVEASFLVNDGYSSMMRAKALKLLLEQADKEIKANGYKSYHAFTTNELIKATLLRRKFVPVNGDALIKWV